MSESEQQQSPQVVDEDYILAAASRQRFKGMLKTLYACVDAAIIQLNKVQSQLRAGDDSDAQWALQDDLCDALDAFHEFGREFVAVSVAPSEDDLNDAAEQVLLECFARESMDRATALVETFKRLA